MSKRAVVLLSGGLDSATVLAIARAEGFAPYTMSFAYGQRQRVELAAAARVAAACDVPVEQRKVVEIDLRTFGGSALTSDAFDVPKQRDATGTGQGVPITYVPARNTIFLSYALAWAEVLGAFDIFIGVNAVDYSGYPDCRPDYIAQFEKMANLALSATADGKRRLRIRAPLQELSKGDIIRRGTELGVDYGLTHSCYDPAGPDGTLACGACDSCQLRRNGFLAAGVSDPTRYVAVGG